MSSYQLQARIEERKLKKERLIVIWRNRMGFDENADINFSGHFEEPDVTLPDAESLLLLLKESPKTRANQMAFKSAGHEIALQRNRRLPSFELTAGYKQLNPDWHGFLVGVAFPLPIFSSNTEAVAQARALERIERTNINSAQKERNQIYLQLLNTIETYDNLLNQFPEHLNIPERFLNTLSISYEEGTQSLNEILKILSLMADTYQTKFNQLENYYTIVMELEKMSGRQVQQGDPLFTIYNPER